MRKAIYDRELTIMPSKWPGRRCHPNASLEATPEDPHLGTLTPPQSTPKKPPSTPKTWVPRVPST